MQKLLSVFIILLSFQFSFSQKTTRNIDMIPSNWEVTENATFERFDHRETLVLNGGRITAKNQEFRNGTIEVEVYANARRSFAGITFRKQKDNMEEVYMRMHKSSQVDAVQYTPIFHNESNWQLYHDYQAQVTFKNEGWNHLRIEVNNQSAEVFVNGKKVMTIDELRTRQSSGEIGLFALFSNRFANFSITPREAVESPTTEKRLPVNPNIITNWEITRAMPYQAEKLSSKDFSRESYFTVETEASGLLPISKYIRKSSAGNFEQNAEDYVIAATTVLVDQDEIRPFSFDFSDKIMVYLNGKLIFKGNNAFRAKGVQFMGHLDMNTNQLYLPLKKGTNEIHCVVIDQANGWGLMAKWE